MIADKSRKRAGSLQRVRPTGCSATFESFHRPTSGARASARLPRPAPAGPGGAGGPCAGREAFEAEKTPVGRPLLHQGVVDGLRTQREERRECKIWQLLGPYPDDARSPTSSFAGIGDALSCGTMLSLNQRQAFAGLAAPSSSIWGVRPCGCAGKLSRRPRMAKPDQKLAAVFGCLRSACDQPFQAPAGPRGAEIAPGCRLGVATRG